MVIQEIEQFLEKLRELINSDPAHGQYYQQTMAVWMLKLCLAREAQRQERLKNANPQ
jgi:DNA-binding SARP family transcriptional activator